MDTGGDTRSDSGASEKRPRGSPTGDTPLQPSKRHPVPAESSRRTRAETGRAGRSLFSAPWNDAEEYALIRFVLLTRTDDRWPSEKSTTYWESAAEFIYKAATEAGTACHRRSGERKTGLRIAMHYVTPMVNCEGTACRTRVTKVLAERYETPLHAEEKLISLNASASTVGSPGE